MRQTVNPTDNTDAVQSPCVNNCCLNEDDICLGCFRSLTEITGWHHASRHERLKILENCHQRKAGAS